MNFPLKHQQSGSGLYQTIIYPPSKLTHGSQECLIKQGGSSSPFPPPGLGPPSQSNVPQYYNNNNNNYFDGSVPHSVGQNQFSATHSGPSLLPAFPGPSFTQSPRLTAPAPESDDDMPPANELVPETRRSEKGKSKGKGKDDQETKKRKRSATIAAVPSVKPAPKGRAPGAPNYSAHLPVGPKGWIRLAEEYNIQAKQDGRPEREARNLEHKFKAWVREGKPTGNPNCPYHIERALIITDLMNERVRTHDLGNELEGDDPEPISVSSDEENVPPPKSKKAKIKTEPAESSFVARRPLADRLPSQSMASRRNNPDLLATISSALSPEAQLAHTEAQTVRTIQATQIHTMAGRIRDVEQVCESLRSQLSETQRELHAAERRADRAEFMLEVTQQGNTNRQYPSSFDRSTSRHRSSYSHRRSHSRSRGYLSQRQSRSPARRQVRHIVQDVVYPEGGRRRSTYIISSDMEDSDAADMQGENDPYGTIRTIVEDSMSPAFSCSPSPFHSAASGLNNMLPAPPDAPVPGPSSSMTGTAPGAPTSPR
ncbi:hypothetical protein C8J56DRAFT_886679 [Mycena floridula]|nr:hypothetical protein C8J56DRAFT_886679 [Mycena floridula]